MDPNIKLKLDKELSEGLEKLVKTMNRRRSLFSKLLKRSFSLKSNENKEYQIAITGPGSLFLAEIKIDITIGGLNGMVYPTKESDIIKEYLHSISHEYNIPLGTLMYFFPDHYINRNG